MKPFLFLLAPLVAVASVGVSDEASYILPQEPAMAAKQAIQAPAAPAPMPPTPAPPAPKPKATQEARALVGSTPTSTQTPAAEASDPSRVAQPLSPNARTYLVQALVGTTRVFRSQYPSLFGMAWDYRGWTEEPQRYLRLNTSLKFPSVSCLIGEPTLNNIWMTEEQPGTVALYSRMDVKIDFNSEDPSQMLVRELSPGLDLFYRTHDSQWINGVGVGFHVDANTQPLTNFAAYYSTPFADDHVRRNWDYVTFFAEWRWLTGDKDVEKMALDHATLFTLRAEPRIFPGSAFLGYGTVSESNFWDAADRQHTPADFDGNRWVLEIENKKMKFVSQLRSGSSSAASFLNWTIESQFTNKQILPLSFYFFKGYGKDLSRYDLMQTSYAVGFELL